MLRRPQPKVHEANRTRANGSEMTVVRIDTTVYRRISLRRPIEVKTWTY